MDPVTRRDFLSTTIAGTAGAIALGGMESLLAQADRDVVVAAVAPRHETTVKMLRECRTAPPRSWTCVSCPT